MYWHFVLLVLVAHAPFCSSFLYSKFWERRDFKTLVEINDHLTGETYIVEEYHANKEDKDWDKTPAGALIIKTKDKHYHITYRTKTGEVNTIDMNAPASMCQTSSLDKPLPGLPTKVQWNWKAKGNFSTIIGPSAMIINITADPTGWIYFSQPQQVRGVWTTRFEEKINNKLLAVTMFGDSSYTWFGKTWRQPTTKKSYFVQGLTLVGKLPADNVFVKVANQNVNISYNFMMIDDIINENDRKKLQIPEGRGCVGCSTYKPHTFKDGYSIKGEAIVKPRKHDEDQKGKNPLPLYIANFQLRYDFEASTYMMFQSTYKEKNGVVTDGQGYNHTVVMENPGYMFSTNSETNKCTVSKKTLFPLVINLPDGTTISFAGPDKLFNFSGFKYFGLTKTRGFFTRVFEKVVKLDQSGISISNSVFNLGGAIVTFYELDSSIYQATSTSFAYTYLPMKLEIRLLDGFFSKTAEITKLITLNFLEYEQLSVNAGALRPISIEHCFPKRRDHLWFEITYRGRMSQSLTNHGGGQLINDFINKVSSKGEVSALRILHPSITYQSNTFKVYAALLQRPDALVDFKRKYLHQTVKDASKFQVYNMVLSEGQCAKKCLQTYGGANNSPCLSFVWCDSTCYLYYQPATPELVKSSKQPTCVFSVRVSPSNANEMNYNENVISNLREGIYSPSMEPSLSNSLNITFRLYYHSYTFYATDLRTDLPRNSESMAGRTNYNTSFTTHIYGYQFKGKYITETYGGNSIYPMNFYSCAKQCEHEPDFYCEAFSYCAASRACLLSRYHPTLYNKTEMAAASDCGVFSRNYLENYKEYPGIVLSEKGFKVAKKVSSANGCAKLCSKNENGVNCQSFDYCDTKHACILHETHFLDIQSKTDINYTNECEHYSRKYLFDYKRRVDTALVKKSITITYTNTSVENCSRLCSLSDQCTSFDFCTGTLSPVTSCHLTATKLGTKSMVAPSTVCSYFTKTYDRHGNYVAPMTQKLTSKQNTYSSGVAGGVGFVMIIIGLVLGAGAIFIFIRYRSRAGF